MLFRHPNKQVNYELKLKLNGKKLTFSKSIRYLGVYLDPHLNWSQHVDILAPKLNRSAGMLAKIRHFVSPETLRCIYFAIFHSILTYACIVWGQTKNRHINRLIKIQNKALRIINFSKFDADTEPLFHSSQILKFTDHVNLQNFLFSHDFLNYNLPSYLHVSFAVVTEPHVPIANGPLICLPKVRTINYGLDNINISRVLFGI